MYKVKNSIKRSLEFIKDGVSSSKSVILANVIILFIMAPFMVTLTRFILKMGDIPYLSYDTVGLILFHHPIVLFLMIMMLFLLVFTIYFEYTFLLLTMYFVKHKVAISLRQLAKETIFQMKKLKISNFLFFLCYFILLGSIGAIRFNSDLLSKFKIPIFIVDFIFENRVIFIILFILAYVSLIAIAIRLMFTLPLMIFKDYTFKKASQTSWYLTKKHLKTIIIQFISVMGTIAIIAVVVNGLLIGIQEVVDTYYQSSSFYVAIVLLTLLQFNWVFNLVLTTIGIFFITISYLDKSGYLPNTNDMFPLINKTTFKQVTWPQKIIVTLGGIWLIISVLSYNYLFLTQPSIHRPLTISHRGVDNGNHVQNSIEALEMTSKKTRPNFVEMDVQETKDKEFIVMHDFKLNQLVKQKGRPNEFTREELQHMTAKENGKQAHLVSFDDYLKRAKELNQKLLIEIKATKQDSPDMVERFIKKYYDTIKEEGHEIQSLSFDVVKELKEKKPDLYVGYIMPFTLAGPPEGKMDFYSVEYTTLTKNLVQSMHNQEKKVYVWTLNDTDTINRMIFYGVDGVITDNMTLLNTVLSRDIKETTYADKLLYFLVGIG
ncbi:MULTISPECIES: glycerophosphoryl diester phosphodiesterase membrane domain-containing protein [unclassified Vagococcus]|uniref:glycerophosphoryl diester phosphodiesterase membrane domain-containing protein n=1 Tax=unclassified Vagococcus TaxID=2648499 RepID=UPI001F5129B9|nr:MULTISPECIES: glycerophosphodiester phosphodiesterase [unclassified Vagococcus]MCI0130285.1 glycerophosphodiester phosphodiesterase [Vagococcus sp. CY53-2]UNM89108.1 glycerophosphodiester phosphodiesterase [Vagococcus sp. CY52-2]